MATNEISDIATDFFVGWIVWESDHDHVLGCRVDDCDTADRNLDARDIQFVFLDCFLCDRVCDSVSLALIWLVHWVFSQSFIDRSQERHQSPHLFWV